ncbi:MAG: hypothetical protein DRI01_08905 [Chloroflexi bacterium]|nr:MAG: hypothetical protein DRI01_08905 [Chloroflexota bacterium]
MEWVVFLVPIFAIVFGIGIALLAVWTEHKKDMALIEKGLYQPKPPSSPEQTVLMWGLILTCVGIALAIGSIWVVGGWLRLGGLVLGLVGIAFLIFFTITKGKKAAT